MALLSQVVAVPRAGLDRLYRRLGFSASGRARYNPLLPAEVAEGDLYTQAHCLFKAGYREAAVIVASTAVRRTLRRIVMACPSSYLRDLPQKTSSWKQYAMHELAYFLFGKGIVDQQLRRDLSQFQKKASRVAYGVKLAPAKGRKMMAALNALRPRLDEAMGRAKRILPALERVSKPQPECLSVDRANQLAGGLALALRLWHARVVTKPGAATNDPVLMLSGLRERALISRKQFRLGCKMFKKTDGIGPNEAHRLEGLLAKALEQAAAEGLKLSVHERCEVPPSGNGQPNRRDARLVENWVAVASPKGSAS